MRKDSAALVLWLVLCCGWLPGKSESDPRVCKTDTQEFAQADPLTAHLAAFESRLEAKLIARIEEKLLTKLEALANGAMDALERKLGDIAVRIDRLGSATERACEQKLETVKQLVQDTLLPALESHERHVQTAHAQTVAKINQALREETKQLGYVVNHPDVFRDAVWIPIQHRFDGTTDFHRNWTAYRTGFGNPRAEFWFGLDNLHDVLRKHDHELLIVLEDYGGMVAHAHYGHFRIGGEPERYAIKSLGEYSGTAGDALRLQEGAPFSTPDVTGATSSELNCATVHQGGWWFWKFPWCTKSNLNGIYSPGPIGTCNAGFTWSTFRTCKYPLKSSKILIRQSN